MARPRNKPKAPAVVRSLEAAPPAPPSTPAAAPPAAPPKLEAAPPVEITPELKSEAKAAGVLPGALGMVGVFDAPPKPGKASERPRNFDPNEEAPPEDDGGGSDAVDGPGNGGEANESPADDADPGEDDAGSDGAEAGEGGEGAGLPVTRKPRQPRRKGWDAEKVARGGMKALDRANKEIQKAVFRGRMPPDEFQNWYDDTQSFDESTLDYICEPLTEVLEEEKINIPAKGLLAAALAITIVPRVVASISLSRMLTKKEAEAERMRLKAEVAERRRLAGQEANDAQRQRPRPADVREATHEAGQVLKVEVSPAKPEPSGAAS